jgi:AcrR family transcriptional regulator
MGGHQDKGRSAVGQPPAAPTLERPSRQLPSGRHGLPRKYVVENQRERIFAAVMQAVSASSYAETTVGDIITGARLSRRTFYEHFDGKEDCFIAAYDAAIEAAVHTTRELTAGDETFAVKIRLVLQRLVENVIAAPALAHSCMVEVVAAGPWALQRRDEAMRTFAALLREFGQPETAAGVTVPPLAAELVVGGLHEMVSARLVQGRADALAEELDQMVYCALVPFCGHARAEALSQRAAA